MKDWCPCLRFHNLILMFTLHSVRIVCESIVRIFHTWETENTWKMTNGSKHLCPLSLSSFVHYHLGFTFFLGLKLTGSMLIVSSWSHDIVIFISKWFCVLIRFHGSSMWGFCDLTSTDDDDYTWMCVCVEIWQVLITLAGKKREPWPWPKRNLGN